MADIARTWRRGPRPVVAQHLARGAHEARSLAFLMIGSLVVWVAQWPRLRLEAQAGTGADFAQLGGTALFGWLMLMPLVFYLVAGVVALASRALGGHGTGLGARLALFWAWLAASPMALLAGLAVALTGRAAAADLLGILWIGAFAGFWVAGQQAASSPPVQA